MAKMRKKTCARDLDVCLCVCALKTLKLQGELCRDHVCPAPCYWSIKLQRADFGFYRAHGVRMSVPVCVGVCLLDSGHDSVSDIKT